MTQKHLFKNCILSFVAHAIMINAYPELFFEQTWDGKNYSIQDGYARRGTITFQDNFCIGAIRNECGRIIYGRKEIAKYMDGFPNYVTEIANKETLEYLLDYHGNEIVPAITSVFWCDEKMLYWGKQDKQQILEDCSLLETLFLPFDNALEQIKIYYDMTPSAVQLLLELVEQKDNDLSKQIVLSKHQQKNIPGGALNDVCIEALREINIALCGI